MTAKSRRPQNEPVEPESAADEAETPEVEAPAPAAVAAAVEAPAPAARVKKAGDWHLVTYGTWQISVDPAGMLMLPRHIHPDHVNDFVACVAVAKDIALEVRTRNAAAGATDSRSLPTRRAVVTPQGPPPPGTTRMQVKSRQHKAATIGRSKRRSGEAASTRAATSGVSRSSTRRNGNPQ